MENKMELLKEKVDEYELTRSEEVLHAICSILDDIEKEKTPISRARGLLPSAYYQ